MKKFLRRNTSRHLKLGRRRKKMQRWHRPRGRDNKMREKRKGRPKTVSIGYKSPLHNVKAREFMVKNAKDLENMEKNSVAVLSHVGKRKKTEIAKMAQERGIMVKNLNIKKFLEGQKSKEGKK
jgi:large subunit ribosomal protein L32e